MFDLFTNWLGITYPRPTSVSQIVSLFAGSDGTLLDLADLAQLRQDAAGATAVTTFGQPVGRVTDQSGGGRNASQSTSAARPASARHPRNGLRNILARNHWEGVPVGPLGSTYVNAGQYLAGSTGGITVEVVGTGVTDGISWVEVRYSGTNSSGATIYRNIGGEGNVAIPAGVTRASISHWAQLVSGTIPAGAVFRHFLNGVDAGMGFISGPSASLVPTGVWQRHGAPNLTLPGTMAFASVYGAYLQVNAGTSIDITLRIGGAQVEFGSAVTNLQNAVSAYDVTEPGQPDIWYCSFDAVDDALTVTVPAGGWSGATVAYATDAGVTILTGQTIAAGTWTLPIPRPSRCYAVVAVNRALTASETSSLTIWLNSKRGSVA